MQSAKCKVQNGVLGKVIILHFAFCILQFAFLLVPNAANAQDYPTWGQTSNPQYRQPAPPPDQPIVPNDPTFGRRPAGPDGDSMGVPPRGEAPVNPIRSQPDPRDPRFQPNPGPAAAIGPIRQQQLPYPFAAPLTRRQEDDVERALADWEQENAKIRTIECKFARYEYDTFDPTGRGRPDQPKSADKGEIKFASPDRAMFQTLETLAPDKTKFQSLGDQGEFWVCDGKAIFEKDPIKKQLIVHKLPPDLQGRAIADGPVPFLFGAQAAKLKARYYLQIITPEERAQNEVWLEAWPRWMADAQNFKFAKMILARDRTSRPSRCGSTTPTAPTTCDTRSTRSRSSSTRARGSSIR